MKAFLSFIFALTSIYLVTCQRQIIEESDNALYPPANVPSPLVKSCDFKSLRSCPIFRNYPDDNGTFVEAAQDPKEGKRKKQFSKVDRYITTDRESVGVIRFGSKFLTPSPTEPTKAFCVTFRYRVTGNASLSLIEQPRGQSEHLFWTDTAPKESWHFHTSQVTQNVSSKIIFHATVTGGVSSVDIADLNLYTTTCYERDGDGFRRYSGGSKALIDDKYWPSNNSIPVDIQPGFEDREMNLIHRFFTDVQAKTCLRFVPRRNDETSYMKFVKLQTGEGCLADLGNVGQSRILLDDQCFLDGYWNIAHMIMHGLGVRHEHVRPDRDDHVEVKYSNIIYTRRSSFEKRSKWNNETLKLPYDYKSVMHFYNRKYAYDKTRDTIQKIGDPSFQLSNQDGPTALDYEKIAAIYCNGATKEPTTPRPTIPTTSTTPRPSHRKCSGSQGFERLQGFISYPGGYGYYDQNENCQFLIKVPADQVITARFKYLDLEDSEHCRKDSITLYDGGNTWSAEMAKVCGFHRPVKNFTTTTNEMLVSFTTDGDFERYGFQLAYRAIEPGSIQWEESLNADLSPADCTFDSGGPCVWSEFGSGKLKWETGNRILGIPQDHTTQFGIGHYMSVNGIAARNRNEYALVKSRALYWEDAYACFSFWYRFGHYFNNTNVGKLEVWYVDGYNDARELLWTSEGSNRDAYDKWVKVDINIWDIESNDYNIIFNGTISSPFTYGGIAVDDVIVSTADCVVEAAPSTTTWSNWVSTTTTTTQPTTTTTTWPYWVSTTTTLPYWASTPRAGSTEGQGELVDGSNGISCHFEDSYCLWKNATAPNAQWLRRSGRSTSGSTFGVQSDHTKETPSSKYLLLNSIPNRPQTARLEVNINPQDGYKCFEFFYKMYGQHLGSVRILAKYYSYSDEEMLLFEARGNKRDEWFQAQASLEGISQPFQLIVEGQTTGQVNGDIGIDDFLLRSNDCYSEPIRRTISTTPPYETPAYEYLCDFEDGQFCANTLTMISDPSSSLMFSSEQGGDLAAAFGGPSYDVSRNNSAGRFAAAFNGYPQSTARLMTSQTFAKNQLNCLTFWYYMSSNGPGTIRVYVEQNQQESQVYVIGVARRFTDSWTNPQVRIRSTGPFRVIIEAVMANSNTYIAIDNVEMSRNSKCQDMARVLMLGRGKRQAVLPYGEFTCRFGNVNAPFCGWATSGDVWQQSFVSGSMPSPVGPDDRFAHATSGRLFVEEGNTRTLSSNATGAITTPLVTSRQSCFRFYYKLSGWYRSVPTDELNVFVKQRYASSDTRRLVATLSASNTYPTFSMGEWVQQKLTIFESQDFEIVLEATTGDSWIGSIAVDEVGLRPEICPRANF